MMQRTESAEFSTPVASSAAALWRSTAGRGLIFCMVVIAVGVIGATLIPRQAADPKFAAAGRWPFVVLLASVGVVIALITFVRVHAFLALIFAAITAGACGRIGSLPQLDYSKPLPHFVNAVTLTATEFGKACGTIGIVIVLASVIGMALLESGAADRIVRKFLAIFGEKRAGLALLLSCYVVSIPMFFDTLFMLLIPLARALRLRTGKDYTLYVLAICCAGAITHSMTIPHPGPLAMIDNLKIGHLSVDPGLSIFAGLLIGLVPLTCGWGYCVWINRRLDVPLTEAPGSSIADLRAIMDRPTGSLPPFWLSLMPVILPVILIWIGSLFEVFLPKSHARPFFAFLGERHIALIFGCGIGLALLMRQRGLTLAQVADLIGPPLETAGVIILITAAGGAFGGMLRNAGVGAAIKQASAGYAVNLVLLAYVVAAVIRVAQGSATVAMLTTSAMVKDMLSPELPFHPLYLFLAIGFGAMFCSWMNDSGFWVVSRLGGLTEKQTLKTWTVLLSIISVSGLLATFALSKALPLPMKPVGATPQRVTSG